MFQAGAGDLICVDNYRVTHGRDGYRDPGRVMLSIWGWSAAAVAVPEGPLDIVRPVIPPGHGRAGYGSVSTAAQESDVTTATYPHHMAEIAQP